MRRLLPLWLASLVLTAAGASPARRIRLIETGKFHGDELHARSGERWLGLFVAKGRSELTATRVSVRRVRDALVDTSPHSRTGKQVTTSRSGKPLFLLNGPTGLRPGPVIMVFGGEKSLEPGQPVRLTLGGVVCGLTVQEAHGLRLILTRGTQTQVLYSIGPAAAETQPTWELRWAGDLDGDGKLDLYIGVGNHQDVMDHRLFLSSRSGRGKLVGELARFVTTGC